MGIFNHDRTTKGVSDVKQRYISRIPQREDIPTGWVAVHSHVIPRRRLGAGGFRAWLQKGNRPKVIPCACKWAPELGTHYRVAKIVLERIRMLNAEAREHSSEA